MGPICWKKANKSKFVHGEIQDDPDQYLLFKGDDSMVNLRMEEKLKNKEAIDVSKCQRTGDGDYILDSFTSGVDYCDAKAESWIWSIGQNLATGQILASTTGKFYENCDFKCLWLR